MLNKKFLVSVSLVALNATAYAGPFIQGDEEVVSLNSSISSSLLGNKSVVDGFDELSLSATLNHQVPADLLVDFTNFAYTANKKEWEPKHHDLFARLVNEGWALKPFTCTTGSADDQHESISGVMGFNGLQVVVATRGTKTVPDWQTNFRYARHPLTRLFSAVELEKESAITAQFFNGVNGNIANGFLQTHLSSWEKISPVLHEYALSLGVSTKDLKVTFTGHSQGAAKAQLNALAYLTDPELGAGVECLERSFILPTEELGKSGFYGMSLYSEPENNGNVAVVVFESPHVFSPEAAKDVNKIIGVQNLLRVENKGDPVIYLSPKTLGFEHAGTSVPINKGGLFDRHFMKNVGPAAIPALEDYYAQTAKAHQETLPLEEAKISQNITTPAKQLIQETKLQNLSLSQKVFNSVAAGIKTFGSGVTSLVSTVQATVGNVTKNFISSFWK